MKQFRSPLIWRLTLWFLLLSLIPIGIVLVFVQRQVRSTIVNQQIQELSDKARLLSLQVTNQPERAQKFVEEFRTENQTAFLMDETGTYIAHSDSNKIGSSAITDFGSDVLQNLLAEEFTQINSNNQYIGSARVNMTDSVVVITESSETRAKEIEDLSRGIILQLAVSLLITSLAGGTAILVVLGPIVQLSNFADRLGSGDLDAKFDDTDLEGELATLARSLNNLAIRVRNSIFTLEQRVAERTADVEAARQQSEKRAQELQAISEISRIISTEQRLETLLALITRLVSERFDFYHVGIFLLDNARRFAVLQAANSEGGQRMLKRGHKLEVGHTGIVGNVAQTGTPRIALDVGSDAVYFDNPDLPNTRSEMALPLNLRGQTVGVLDVQSLRPGAFNESDANTLGILADHVAITIDNARLFEQSQQALNELQSLYRQYQAQEWDAFVKKETTLGYHQLSIGGKVLDQAIQSDEIQEALKKGNIHVGKAEDGKSESTIVIPVKLRGQVIGVLNVKAPTTNRAWNQDEINLMQAVSDRLALALENARLLQESQRRAAKEQKIGDVTAKIGASINMRSVLQTAVEELGRALPGSEVVIQFENNGK